MKDATEVLSLAEETLGYAKRAGADEADVVLFDSADVSISQRLGDVESIERSESLGVGLRTLIKGKSGFQQGIVSSSDVKSDALQRMAEQAVAIANAAPEDPHLAVADAKDVATSFPDLDLYDGNEPDIELLKQHILVAEKTALDVEGITNSDGAEISYGTGMTAIAISNGFAHAYPTSSSSLSVSVIAGEGLNMETDYDYHVARHASDLRSPELIGQTAAERAVRRLNPKKQATCQVPVVFDKRVARGLLASFAGAINGAGVARGTSFLKDHLGQPVFAKGLNIIDDPFIKRALGSQGFDAEGVAAEKRHIIEDGTLTTWLMDIRSANQLGLKTTGHASRGLASAPSPSSTNFYLEAGDASVDELISDIKSGFYVTDTFGMGVNGVTGDYSQGAAGLWIENGKLTYAVSEMTIASNLKDMFMALTPANDLEFTGSKNSPTVRIEGMTVAGT